MAESIEILIAADDQASRKIADVSRNVDASVKKIRESGQKAKASTEFVGSLAKSLGGTALGQYAGELGQLTEKVSAFSEVSKLGGAGALAFKVGLAGLAATIGVKVGQALGTVIFQTEAWTRSLAEANAEAKKLDQLSIAAAGERFSRQREDIELIRNPEEKRAAQKALLESLQKDLDGVAARVQRGKKEVEEWNASWFKFGNRAAFAEQSKQSLETEKSRLDELRKQRDELNLALSVRQQENEAIRKRNELETKSEDYISGLRQELELLKASKAERIAIEARRNAPTASDEARRLMQEKEAIIEKQEAEKKASDEAKQAAEKQKDLYAKELQSLEERRIALEQGDEAAKAYALTVQGLNQQQAKEIVALESRLSEREKMRKLESTAAPPLEATISRLLTRGPAQDKTDKLIAVTDQLPQRIAEEIYKREKQNTIQPRALQVEIIK